MTTRVSTGLRAARQMLGGGLLPGTLTVVYGATGIGKTHLGLAFASHGRVADGAPGHPLRHERARRLAAAPRVCRAPLRLAAQALDAYRHAHGGSVSAAGADGRVLLRRVSLGRASCASYQVPTAGRARVRLELEGDVQPRALHRAAVRVLPPGAGSRGASSWTASSRWTCRRDYIQPYIFDELYRKVIHRDGETLGMEICLPVWKHRAFIDAHLYDHARGDHAPARDHRGDPARAPASPARSPRATSARWRTPSSYWGASGSAIAARRASCAVVKHRGSAMSDEIAEYRVTEQGLELRRSRRAAGRRCVSQRGAGSASVSRRRRRVRSARAALAFVEDVGVCSTFYRFPDGSGLPVGGGGRAARIRAGRAGRITTPGSASPGSSRTRCPRRRHVYYGKLLKGRPVLVALDVFPAFYALVRGAAAGARLSRRSTRRAGCPLTAKRLMDSLDAGAAAVHAGPARGAFMLEPAKTREFERAHGRAAAGALDRQDRGALRADVLVSLGSARALAAGAGGGGPAALRAAPRCGIGSSAAVLCTAARYSTPLRAVARLFARAARRRPMAVGGGAGVGCRVVVRVDETAAGWPGRWVVSAR